MSKEVDERVVQMQFDNRQFESNVRTSMSTLEKLKHALKLDGASKGLDEVQKTANNMSFNGLYESIDGIGTRFSHVQMTVQHQIDRMVDSMVNFGKRIISALTIEPTKTGFNEYEQKLDSTRTIMNSTGESLEKVNGLLEELNKYSDETIYSFKDMTQNIGKFTNAGVKLEDAVAAIKGVSNEAAVSGANAQEASRAMYNFAQALSAGYVKLIDWKSIENANMATVEFKDQLLETAYAMGTVKKTADGMYDTGKRTLNATQNFNDSLTDQWMTSEVLIQTLNNYAQDTRKMTDAEKTAYREKLKTIGYTEEQIDKIEELGHKAADSAQETTKLSMMWDVLKETAQSGWSQTWETIVGDFNQAKKLFTALTTFFSNIIDGMSNMRNSILKSALGRSFEDLKKRLESTMQVFHKSADSLKNVVKSMQDYEKVVGEIIKGDWGNGQKRWDALTKAGYDWAHAQNLVNEKLGSSVRHTSDYKEAVQQADEAVAELSNSDIQLLKNLSKCTDEQLRAAGYTQEQIEAIKVLRKQADDLGMSVDDFLDHLDEMDGRWIVLDSFRIIGESLVTVFKAIGDAFNEAFYGTTNTDDIIQKRADSLFNIIVAFHKFAESLKISEEDADKLKRTFKGLFAIIDIIRMVIGTTFRIAFEIVSSVLSYFNLEILDVTASIGDAVTSFRDWIKENNYLGRAISFIVTKLLDAITAIVNFVKNSEMIQNAWKTISDFFTKSTEGITNWIEGFKTADDIPKYILDSITNGLSYIGEKLKSVLEFVRNMITNGFQKIISGDGNIVFDTGKNIISLLLNGIKNGVSYLINYLKSLGTDISNQFKAIDISTPLNNMKERLSNFVESIKGIFEKFNFGKIIAVGVSGVLLKMLYRVINIIDRVTRPIEGLTDLIESAATMLDTLTSGIKKFAKAAAFKLKTEGLKNIAIALGIVAGIFIAIVLLGKIASPEEMHNALKTLILLTSLIAIMAYVLSKLSDSSVSISRQGAKVKTVGADLIAIAGSLLVLSFAIKMLGKMSSNDLSKGLTSMVGVMGIMMLLMVAIRELVKGRNAQYLTSFGKVMVQLAVAMALMIGVIKLTNVITNGDAVNALAFAIMFATFMKLTAMITQTAGSQVKNLGGMMIKLAVSMALMIGVIKLTGVITNDDAYHALGFAIMYLAFMKLVVLIANSLTAGTDMASLGKLLVKLSISMVLMVGVIKLCNFITTDEIAHALYFMAEFLAILAITAGINRAFGADSAGKFALMMIALAGAIAILAGVTVLLGTMDYNGLLQGVSVIIMLGTVLAALMYVTQYMKSAVGTLAVLALVVAAMTTCVILLSILPWKDIIAPTIALVAMMAAFGLMAKLASDVQAEAKSLILMTVVIAVLTAALVILAIQDWKNILAGGIALSITMIALAGAMKILSTMASTISVSTIGKLLLMAGVMAVLGVELLIFQNMDWEKILAGAGALSVLILALAGASVIMQFASTGGFVLAVVVLALGAALLLAAAAFWVFCQGLVAVVDILPQLSVGIQMLGFGISVFIETIAASKEYIMDFAMVMNTLGFTLLTFLSELALGMFLAGVGAVALAGGAIILGAGLLVAAAGLAVTGVAFMLLAAGITLFAGSISLLESTITTSLNNASESAKNAGNNIVLGFAEGIKGAASTITEACTKFVGGVASTICTLLGIHSPSTVAMGWGKNTAIGFANGLEDGTPEVEQASEGFIDKIKNFFTGGKTKKSARKNGEEVGSDITDGIMSGINMDSITESLTGQMDLSSFGTQMNLEGMLAGESLGDGVAQGFNNSSISNLTGENVFDFSSLRSDMNIKGVDVGGQFSSGIMDGIDTDSFNNMIGDGSFDFESIQNGMNMEGLLSGQNFDSGMMEGILDGSGDLNASTTNNLDSMLDTIDDKKPKFKEAGSSLMVALKDGIENKKVTLNTSVSKITSAMYEVINNQADEFKKLGVYIVEGFVQGISDTTPKAVEASKSMAAASLEATRTELDVNSPSRKFMEIGEYVGKGFANGINNMKNRVKETSGTMASLAIDSTKDAIEHIRNIATGNIDITPTIRPVVSMDDIATGNLNLISSLDASISRPVSSWSQKLIAAQNDINESNSQVISAIRGLQNDIMTLYTTSDQEIALYVDSNKLTSALVNPMNRQLNMVSRMQGGI